MPDNRPLQPKQLLLAGILTVVVIVAVVSLISGKGVDRDRETVQLHEDCGSAMADLTRRALGKGKTILVVEHDGSGLPPDKQQWMKAQIEGFYAALKPGVETRKQGVSSGNTSAHQGRVNGSVADPDRWRRNAYAAMADQAPKVDAIVSFVGEPVLGRSGPEEWSHLPPIVCFSFSGDDVPALMRAGVVASAIVPRRTPMSIKASKKKSWFEVMYEVLTPENLSQWAQEQ